MKTKRAFTLVEFMLAMAFLGILLVGVASIVIHVVGIYQNGLTMRGVSTVGREIVSDFTRTISSSNTAGIQMNPTEKTVTQKTLNTIRSDYYLFKKDSEGNQLGGIFCTGSYSYIWNTAKNISKARENYGQDIMSRTNITSTEMKRLVNDDIFVINAKDGVTVPRLARVSDPNRYACSHSSEYDGNGFPTKLLDKNTEETGYYKRYGETGVSVSHVGQGIIDIRELINDDKVDLAIYHLEIFPATQNDASGQIFYSGMFILGTMRGGINVKANGNYCTGKSDASDEYSLYDMDYCAVNKFNFAVRATGESDIYRNGGQ